MEILQSNQLNIDNEDEARKVRLSSSTTVDSGIFVCQNLQSEEDSIKEQKRGNFVENSLIFFQSIGSDFESWRNSDSREKNGFMGEFRSV